MNWTKSVRVVTVLKRIGLLAVLFLLMAGLLRASDHFADKRWKEEMFSPGLRGKTVVIDPGHGGADPGAVAAGAKESHINMDLALALKKLLENSGATVKLTRQGDRGLVPEKRMSYFEQWLILEKRRGFAHDQRSHMLISIHANSNKDPRASGGIVFYSDEFSGPLAESIQKHLNLLYKKERQVEQNRFTIINGNSMPSVLIEAGFISNKQDREMLIFQQERVARAILAGLRDYADSLKPVGEAGRQYRDN